MVKITVLHNELEKFVNEDSGLSLLIEAYKMKILFDVSYKDDIFINAAQKNINLEKIDYLIISHGHIDHTEGLMHIDFRQVKCVLCHPLCLKKKYYQKKVLIGSPFSSQEIKQKTRIILSKEPFWIKKNKIIFLGEIPRLNSFEGKTSVGNVENGEKDFVIDDSAIAIKSQKGLIVISGCSHSGICNTINYAIDVCNEKKVFALIGGFHLFNKEQTDKTIEFIKQINIEHIYPMHCLDEYAFSEFEKIGGKKVKTLDAINL
ncbi:MAG: MBL fold metallo-hydrolase [archaeon]